MRDGYPTTEPIQTKQEAIDAINSLFQMAGYSEGQGDLWLGHTLDRLKEFLGDPHPFELPPNHTKDSDCTVGADGCCIQCGVGHTEQCPVCGGCGFHEENCMESDAYAWR